MDFSFAIMLLYCFFVQSFCVFLITRVWRPVFFALKKSCHVFLNVYILPA